MRNREKTIESSNGFTSESLTSLKSSMELI